MVVGDIMGRWEAVTPPRSLITTIPFTAACEKCDGLDHLNQLFNIEQLQILHHTIRTQKMTQQSCVACPAKHLGIAFQRQLQQHDGRPVQVIHSHGPRLDGSKPRARGGLLGEPGLPEQEDPPAESVEARERKKDPGAEHLAEPGLGQAGGPGGGRPARSPGQTATL